MINRVQEKNILIDLDKKMVFLSWPRQVWKTFLSKKIAENFKNPVYLNFDRLEDRIIIKNESWLEKTDLLIFDEIHKMKNWKTYLKWVFDTKNDDLKILVTWSARLDTFRQSWDSLAWRFFLHRILPFSIKELNEVWYSDIDLDDFIFKSWFPEPFLSEDNFLVQRWRNQYSDALIREDVLDFENIHNLKSIQLLLKILQERVGSLISYSSLAEDIWIASNTVKKYIEILENLYIIFRVSPFSKNIARAIKKESKVYFFDTWMIKWDDWIKFENLVWLSLLKDCMAKKDMLWEDISLNFLRTKDWKEIDFCICKNDELENIIEVKNSDSNFSKNLFFFWEKYWVSWVQVVKNLKREKKSENGLFEIISWKNFLKDLFL